MQVLALIALVVFVVALMDAFTRACEHVVSVFGSFVGGWRSEGWPRGVQEEDRDWRWGRAPGKSPKAGPPRPRVNLTRVQSTTHVR